MISWPKRYQLFALHRVLGRSCKISRHKLLWSNPVASLGQGTENSLGAANLFDQLFFIYPYLVFILILLASDSCYVFLHVLEQPYRGFTENKPFCRLQIGCEWFYQCLTHVFFRLNEWSMASAVHSKAHYDDVEWKSMELITPNEAYWLIMLRWCLFPRLYLHIL